MKKVWKVLGLTAMLSASISMVSIAGEWKQDNVGYWWVDDNGAYPTNSWQWLDGNKDGIAECYYFATDGYMAANTIVDGYTVNADGAWTVNGVVQTQQSSNFQSNGNVAGGLVIDLNRPEGRFEILNNSLIQYELIYEPYEEYCGYVKTYFLGKPMDVIDKLIKTKDGMVYFEYLLDSSAESYEEAIRTKNPEMCDEVSFIVDGGYLVSSTLSEEYIGDQQIFDLVMNNVYNDSYTETRHFKKDGSYTMTIVMDGKPETTYGTYKRIGNELQITHTDGHKYSYYVYNGRLTSAYKRIK